MSEMQKAQNAQRSNSEWKALRLEKEQKQGYNRRKHGQRDITRFEDQYYASQRPAKSAGRGTDWQDRHWSSSSSSSWQWSSDR
eukprot:858029-Amphidinium_carterae.1